MFHKQTLKNGLTILKVPIPGAKSVLVDVFVKTGSRHESARVNGISHFLEHLFFKGSKLYPTAMALSHALDAIGAEYNANTGKEHTQYYIKAARAHFGFIFEILTDMIQNPVFAAEEIEREKGVIVEEINMYRDTPMRHVEDVLEELMWPGHPLGRNIAGTKEVINKITRDDIMDYVQAFYQPGNLILSVAGAFPEKTLRRLLDKYWANLPRKKFPGWQKAKTEQKKPAVRVEHKKTEQFHLAMGFRSYDYNHPNYIVQIVLAAILGSGMSSRLFVEIREREGWAYYVKAATGNYQDTGNFVIQAGVRRAVLGKVIRKTIEELRKIRQTRVSRTELNKAKEYLKGTMTLSLEESETLLGWYLDQLAFRKTVLSPEGAFALIDKVKPADIQRVANDIFQGKKLNLAVVGPASETKGIRNLLKI